MIWSDPSIFNYPTWRRLSNISCQIFSSQIIFHHLTCSLCCRPPARRGRDHRWRGDLPDCWTWTSRRRETHEQTPEKYLHVRTKIFHCLTVKIFVADHKSLACVKFCISKAVVDPSRWCFYSTRGELRWGASCLQIRINWQRKQRSQRIFAGKWRWILSLILMIWWWDCCWQVWRFENEWLVRNQSAELIQTIHHDEILIHMNTGETLQIWIKETWIETIYWHDLTWNHLLLSLLCVIENIWEYYCKIFNIQCHVVKSERINTPSPADSLLWDTDEVSKPQCLRLPSKYEALIWSWQLTRVCSCQIIFVIQIFSESL